MFKYIQWASEQKGVGGCQCIPIRIDCSRIGNVYFPFSHLNPQIFVYTHNLQVYQRRRFTNPQWHVIPKDGCFQEKHLLTLPLFWFEQKSKDAWSTYVPWRESVHPSQQMHLATSRGEKLRELENCHVISSYQLMLHIRKSLLQIWEVDYTASKTLSSSVQHLSFWPGDTYWNFPVIWVKCMPSSHQICS